MIFLRHISVHLVIVITVRIRIWGPVMAVVLHVFAGPVIAFDVATPAGTPGRVRTKAHLVGAQRTTQSHANWTTPTAATPRHILAVT